MRKYLSLIYVTFSLMSFAQFKDNVFDRDQAPVKQQQTDANVIEEPSVAEPTFEPSVENQSSLVGAPGDGGENPEGPGNPGEPTPINGYVPLLLLSGIALIVYFQRKNKKINI